MYKEVKENKNPTDNRYKDFDPLQMHKEAKEMQLTTEHIYKETHCMQMC